MNWRWTSLAGFLAALAIAYGAFNGRTPSPAAVGQPPPQPGYYLRDAVITETQEDGSLGLRLIAERIEEQPREGGIAAEQVRVQYFQAQQKEWRLSAQRALVPDDSRIVTFSGDVELRPSDAPDAFLRTDSLALDTERNIARAVHSPVELQFGMHTMTVQDFMADLNTEKLRMESASGAYRSR